MADQTQFHRQQKPRLVNIAGTGGSAAAPAFALESDPDSGVYLTAGATVFVADGVEVGRVDVGGIVPVDAGVTAAKLATALAGSADGLGILRVARATFDPSANLGDRTVAAHTLGVTIPDSAIIIGGLLEVLTTFTSANDTATIAFSVEAADDIVPAVAIDNVSNPWDVGKHVVEPEIGTAESSSIKTSAARAVTATVGVQALTAGKAIVFLYYLQSA